MPSAPPLRIVSRTSFEGDSAVIVSVVLPLCSSNSVVIRDSPGKSSNDSVWTTRSGGAISRQTPRIPTWPPSGRRITKRNLTEFRSERRSDRACSQPAYRRKAMIAYHGGPFSDATIATEIWRKHPAMISFARPEQLGIAAEYASSFVLDNGAFSLWRAGQRRPAWDSYYRWVEAWRNHPGFDFAIIPDVIEVPKKRTTIFWPSGPFTTASPFITSASRWADF